MERVEHLLETFDELLDCIYDPDLEPDPQRSDWAEHREELDVTAELFEHGLLPALDDAKDDLEATLIPILETRAAYIGLGVFAALKATGQEGRALPMLTLAAERGRRGEWSDFFAAAVRDPNAAAQIALARHRIVSGRPANRSELKQLAKHSREKAIAAEATRTLRAPRPVKSAPGLSTLNGFGTGLYGSRERDGSDGSEVKTLCLSALYVPLFPLKAYRVIDHGDGSYVFLTKNPLSKFARTYRKLLAAAVVLVIGWWGVSKYLNSPNRLAGKDIAAANELRVAGDVDGALDRYERAISNWSGKADDRTVAGAATSAIELRLERVPSPLTPTAVDDAAGVIRSYRALSHAARSPENDALVSTRLLGWADDLGTSSTKAMNAAIGLLERGLTTINSESRPPLVERHRKIKTTLASELAPRRPTEALTMLIELGANDEAGALLEKISASPSLLREIAPQAELYLASAHGSAEHATAIGEALAKAREADADDERAAALASGEGKQIARTLEKYPGDHSLVAAMAELDRASGNGRAALERLAALGEPGWLTGDAQQTLASAYADVGELGKADDLLAELLAVRLPLYKAAAGAYFGAVTSLRDKMAREAQVGRAPPAVMAKLRGLDDGAAQAAFDGWVAERMESDTALDALRDAYAAYVYVVPASLSHGTIKLRRANAATGSERETLLADAEAAFLAISDDASGVPSYHLGLGQVYHRLGKAEEGDSELQGLLDKGDPQLSLAVSRAYRELGLTDRARTVAEKVFRDSESPLKETAAHQLTFIVETLDEKEKWLELSDNSLPSVQVSLMQTRAQRAAENGDENTAADLFRKVAAYYAKSAKHSATSANNAAVAHIEIYRATGDDSELAKARNGLESSLRLEPGNALVVGNLAAHCDYEGWLSVLSRYVPTHRLRLERADAVAIAAALTSGPKRAEVLEAAAKSGTLRRGRELTAQETLLAPGGTSGWSRTLAWAELLRDDAKIAAIAKQLSRTALDTAPAASNRAAWIRGELDEDAASENRHDVKRFEKMLGTAKEAKSSAGLGIGHYLLASALAARGWRQSNAEDLELSLQHGEEAKKNWPALGDTISVFALQLAIVRSIKSNPEVAAMHKTGWRELRTATMLGEALAGPNAESIARVVAADPALSAAKRALASAESTPSLTMWIVGRLSGDEALTERAATLFDQERSLAAAEIARLFAPTSRQASLRLALLRGRGELGPNRK